MIKSINPFLLQGQQSKSHAFQETSDDFLTQADLRQSAVMDLVAIIRNWV